MIGLKKQTKGDNLCAVKCIEMITNLSNTLEICDISANITKSAHEAMTGQSVNISKCHPSSGVGVPHLREVLYELGYPAVRIYGSIRPETCFIYTPCITTISLMNSHENYDNPHYHNVVIDQTDDGKKLAVLDPSSGLWDDDDVVEIIKKNFFKMIYEIIYLVDIASNQISGKKFKYPYNNQIEWIE